MKGLQMTDADHRAHGVTPGLRDDYADRTAEHQARFVMPRLRPGMELVDIGCGPGTITVGLALAVAPGRVTGVDHDEQHVAGARALASERGATNVAFVTGDARSLPFADGSFDVAFENDVFVHLAADAVVAAREAYRVLRPGGFLAARDADADGTLWGHRTAALRRFDELFLAWQRGRGSDIMLGKRLPDILREAGFRDTAKSVSADTKGSLEETRAHARIMAFLLDGPLGAESIRTGRADRPTLERLKAAAREWGEHPDAFFANVHVEVIGRKAG